MSEREAITQAIAHTRDQLAAVDIADIIIREHIEPLRRELERVCDLGERRTRERDNAIGRAEKAEAERDEERHKSLAWQEKIQANLDGLKIEALNIAEPKLEAMAEVVKAHMSERDEALHGPNGTDAMRATISRIWEALGIATYADADGKSISEHVAEAVARATVLEALLSGMREALGVSVYDFRPLALHAEELVSRVSALEAERDEAVLCFREAREALAKAEAERDEAREQLNDTRVYLDESRTCFETSRICHLNAESRVSALEALLAECETVLLKREGSICCQDCIVVRLETTRLLAKLKDRRSAPNGEVL